LKRKIKSDKTTGNAGFVPKIVFSALAAVFLLAGCSQEAQEPPPSLAGRVIILQAFGGGESGAAGASHSFVELYNLTDRDISLSGTSLFHADGTTVPAGQINSETEDGAWNRLPLSGTIPAGGSFLILGPRTSPGARHQIPDGYGDINDENFVLSNRAFKVALISGTPNLAGIQNPFDHNGRPVAGYIDMVGAANEYGTRDRIFGFEYAPARNSGSVAVRRIDLYDTDVNSDDFIGIRYALGGMSNELLEVRRPRNSGYGAWDPFAAPAVPERPATAEGLMILQANTHGNDNGIPQGAATGGGFARSVVELFNNTDDIINLADGNYYLHIGRRFRDGADAPWDVEWTNVVRLTGTVPAQSSFLVVSGNAGGANATPRAVLPDADQVADFVLGNDGFKIALMTNQSLPLAATNPFAEPELFAYYIDMLGAGNAGVGGFETEPAGQSRPQGPRRTSLADTNDNSADFSQADFRGFVAPDRGIPDSELYKLWPRNSSMGEWDPITGHPARHPAVVPAGPGSQRIEEANP